jgi:ketosteroid isomerase-like protein
MSAEKNKTIALRWFNLQTGKSVDLAAMDKLTTPDFVYHHPANPKVRTHEQRKKEVVIPLGKAFPDLKASVQDVIAEGDKVALRYLMSGTHKGEFMGIAPTDRRLALTSICILRLAEGKVAEMWVENNSLVMMQQLGVVPLPAGQFHIKE